MLAARILNPSAAKGALEPVALSQRILVAAREADAPEQCTELDRLTAQLHAVSPELIDSDPARIAFWVNLYNALLLHVLCLKPLRGSVLRHLHLFDRIAYRVGEQDFPLNLIENGVLRRNRRAPLRLRRSLRSADPRFATAPRHVDPRIHFALNCGARSCPPIRAYAPDALGPQLELATTAYLRAATTVDPERRRVTLPRLMRIYRRDFGDRRRQLEFAARYVPEISEPLADGDGAIRIRYGRFDWALARPASA